MLGTLRMVYTHSPNKVCDVNVTKVRVLMVFLEIGDDLHLELIDMYSQRRIVDISVYLWLVVRAAHVPV